MLYEVGLQINTNQCVSIISMARLKTRTLRYELRLTPVEKESWSVFASAMGLDLSEYIRRCVERRQITTNIQPEVNRQTAVELGRIGVNLNQLIPFHFEEATLSWKVLLLITRCLG